jgi:SPP1 family predicted phage head-tail adaptor
MANKTEHIGGLRERMHIEYATISQNSYGEEIEVWVLLSTVWCEVAYNLNTSNENITSERQTATTDVRFTIRRRTDVNNKMRITYRQQQYDIVAITESPDLFWTFIEAKNRQ